MESLFHQFSDQITAIEAMLMFLTAILHLIFAGAVAKDAGKLTQLGRDTILVSGFTWAFATLVGGVFVAGLYWLLHHLPLLSNRKQQP